MKIDGFRVNLGELSKGENLQTKVTKDAISALLDEARKSPDFEKNKGSYEFRLRKQKSAGKNNNDAVLELRRPSTGFFAKFWPGSKSRRSQERSDAYAAIRQHMSGLAERKAGDIRKADARTLASNVLHFDDVARTNVATDKLYGLYPSGEALKEGLSSVLERSLKDTIAVGVSPKELDIRNQTMGFLNRAQVSINDFGQLTIKTPAASGNGQENLDTIVNFFRGKNPGLSFDVPGDSRLKNLVESFLLHVRVGSDQAISRPVEAGMKEKIGFEAYANLTEMNITVRETAGSLSVNFLQAGNLRIGPVGEDAINTVRFGAKLQFHMSSEKLMEGLTSSKNMNIYERVSCNVGSALEHLEKTNDEELNETLSKQRVEMEMRRAKESEEQRIADMNKNINRGPTKSPFGEN